MKILVRGPALTRTGYGEHCRSILRILREIDNLDIYLLPVNWGHSTWLWEDTEERAWIDTIIKKTALYGQQNGQYDVSVQVTIPNEWQRMAPVNIGITAGIETTKVSPAWLQKCNEMDKIITISEHSKRGFTETFYEGVDKNTGRKLKLKCLKDVEVLHYPVKQDILDSKLTDLGLNLTTKFNFLTVAQWGPRKNLHSTINWFVEEFIDNPEAGLVVKTFLKGGCVLDRDALEKEFKKTLSKYKNRKCKVYLLHGDLKDEEMHSLYCDKQIHALVSLTHGEGFGLPLFEAAYCGLPIIATDWSGHLDFLYKPTKDKKGKEKNKPYFARVDYDLQPIPDYAVWDGVLQRDSMWAFPQQGSYKMKLRDVYKDYGRYKSQADKLKEWVCDNFSRDKQDQKFKDFVKDQIEEIDVDDWLIKLEQESVSYD